MNKGVTVNDQLFHNFLLRTKVSGKESEQGDMFVISVICVSRKTVII